MKKFNKKQRDYLDKVVEESPDRLTLANKLYNSYNYIERDLAKLGSVWETQWQDADRYVSDKFIEVHGAGYSISKYY